VDQGLDTVRLAEPLYRARDHLPNSNPTGRSEEPPMFGAERCPPLHLSTHDGTRTGTSLDDPHGPPSSGVIPQNWVFTQSGQLDARPTGYGSRPTRSR